MCVFLALNCEMVFPIVIREKWLLEIVRVHNQHGIPFSIRNKSGPGIRTAKDIGTEET